MSPPQIVKIRLKLWYFYSFLPCMGDTVLIQMKLSL